MHKRTFALLIAVPILAIWISLSIFLSCTKQQAEGEMKIGVSNALQQQTIAAMTKKFGDGERQRIETGIAQVAARWQTKDGSEQEFRDFCLKYYFADPAERDVLFSRFQRNLESLYGNLHRISRDFNWALQVDDGLVHPVDYLFANYNAFSHTSDDLFKTKLAFTVLLNFPLQTLEDKNAQGMSWSREKWAETRLAEIFSDRVPAEIAQKRSEAYVAADDYINNYNIYMHNLVDDKGERLFPDGLKLISHWGLRDELKGQYANPDGLPRQKMIAQVMERIIRQKIPQVVINNEKYDWNPFTNTVYEAGTTKTVQVSAESETRYQHIWDIYQAERLIDPYFPQAPSLVDRRFKISRELPESDVEALLKEILTAPVLKDMAALIQKRLDRPLQPFDIWYNGFKARSDFDEAKLDRIVGNKYPTVKAFQQDVPNILQSLGFTAQKARFLADHIQVDPSRGAGHASGAEMREDQAHLRTRIPKGGMKYKGFNIAIHEMGHNVEQVFSLNEMDYYTLNGVPNTAFTEAFAFVFQSRDLDVLGIKGSLREKDDLRALDDMWNTFEISGVALTDMYIWRWMYAHPEANPQQLHQAMLETAKQVWNDYFAQVLGQRDQDLLAIYSHIVDGAMYTPDYPMGFIISFQIEQYLKSHQLATEMERMCRLGRLSPQVWMQQAVGEKVSAKPLIEAANRAAKSMGS